MVQRRVPRWSELREIIRPRHRLARFAHVLRWWARWLPPDRNPGPGRAQVLTDVRSPGDEVPDLEHPSGDPLVVRATRVG